MIAAKLKAAKIFKENSEYLSSYVFIISTQYLLTMILFPSGLIKPVRLTLRSSAAVDL